MRRHPLAVAVVIVAVVNLAGRLWFVLTVQPEPVSDFAYYFQAATDIANGNGYLLGGEPSAYWPVGWPAILGAVFAVTGPSLTAGLVVQAVASTGIAVLVLLLTHHVTRSVLAGVLAATAYTAIPTVWMWDSVLASEPTFTLLLLASLYVWLKRGADWRWMAAAGALMGAAALVRPTVLAIPALVLAAELARRDWRKAIAATGLFAAGMAVVIAPWTIRNAIVMDSPILVSTNGGTQLWMGTVSDSYYWPTDPAANPLLTLGEVERDTEGRRIFLETLLHEPRTVANGVPGKMRLLFGAPNSAVYRTQDDLGPVMALRTATVYGFPALAALALLGALGAVLRRSWPGVVLVGFALLYTATFAVFPTDDRYRFPVEPVLAVLAGVAASRAIAWLHFRQHWRWPSLATRDIVPAQSGCAARESNPQPAD